MDDPIQHFDDSTVVGSVPAVAFSGQPARVWTRLQAGPLAAVVEALARWLSGLSYASTMQINVARAAVRLGGWMLSKNLVLGDLDQARVMGMVEEDNECHPTHGSANQNVSAVLRFPTETGHPRPGRVIQAEIRPGQACLGAWFQFPKVEQEQRANRHYKARHFAVLDLLSGQVIGRLVLRTATMTFQDSRVPLNKRPGRSANTPVVA